MAKIGFIVNPTAGRGRGRRLWESFASTLSVFGESTVWYSERPGHATELARAAADAGYQRVGAVGGDGTLAEVVNGLVGTDTALGIVPGGTGNDFVRGLGVPLEMKSAAELLFTGETRKVDLGKIESGPYFINVAGVGFDAEVARTVNSYPKYLGGTIPYLAGIATTLWRYKPYPVEIELDGTVLRRDIFLVAIGNASSYGGGMKICPDAKIDDGLFSVCIGSDIGRLEVLRLVPSIYSGGHVGHPKVEILTAKHIEIRSPHPVPGMADGELVGAVPLAYDILPGALDLVLPDGPLPLCSTP